jgi:hypothetical protein
MHIERDRGGQEGTATRELRLAVDRAFGDWSGTFASMLGSRFGLKLAEDVVGWLGGTE